MFIHGYHIPGTKEINRKCRTIFCTNIFGSIIRIYVCIIYINLRIIYCFNLLCIIYIRALYVRINMRRDIRSVYVLKYFISVCSNILKIFYIFLFFFLLLCDVVGHQIFSMLLLLII